MGKSGDNSPQRYGEGIFTAISVGFFLILIGAIFFTTPNFLGKVLAFFRNFDIVRVPHTEMFLPAPASTGAHSSVYSAVMRFCFAWGIFQIFVLAIRFVARSPLSKKAETVSGIVFWTGTGFLIRILLGEPMATVTWFVFWSGVLMLIGTSLVVRAIIFAIRA